MKKTVLAICLLNLLVFAACKNANTSQSKAIQTETSDTAKLQYRCPMDCEHGKVYNEQGKCPVCEMDLKEVK